MDGIATKSYIEIAMILLFSLVSLYSIFFKNDFSRATFFLVIMLIIAS